MPGIFRQWVCTHRILAKELGPRFQLQKSAHFLNNSSRRLLHTLQRHSYPIQCKDMLQHLVNISLYSDCADVEKTYFLITMDTTICFIVVVCAIIYMNGYVRQVCAMLCVCVCVCVCICVCACVCDNTEC